MSTIKQQKGWLNCSKCPLHETRTKVVLGRGNPNAKIMFVGEGPGPKENDAGEPFVGPSGVMLNQFLETFDINRADIFLDNMVACFPSGTSVRAKHTRAGYSRHYSGDLIRIVAGGNELCGTPNHPILTTTGMRPLGSIEKGDHVIGCRFRERVGARDPDIKNGPAHIEDVVGAISEDGTGHRVAGTHMDFHGDGIKSDIDIVVPKRLLTNGVKSSSQKHRKESILKTTSKLQGVLKLLRSSYGSLVVLLGRHAGFCPGYSCFAGPLPLVRQGSSLVPDNNSLPLPPDGNAKTADVLTESSPTDPSLIRKRLEALPADISVNKVIEKGVIDFSGHVYNLSTDCGWYTAGGHIVSNCWPHITDVSGKRQTRKPSPEEMIACRDRIHQSIYVVDPIIVVSLGAPALQGLTGTSTGIVSAAGDVYETKVPGWYVDVDYSVYAMLHPAYLLRQTPLKDKEKKPDEKHPIRRTFRHFEDMLETVGLLNEAYYGIDIT